MGDNRVNLTVNIHTALNVQMWMTARRYGIGSVLREVRSRYRIPQMCPIPDDVKGEYLSNKDKCQSMYNQAWTEALEQVPMLEKLFQQAHLKVCIAWDSLALRVVCPDDPDFDIGGLCASNPAPEIVRLVCAANRNGISVGKDLYDALYTWFIPYHNREEVEKAITANLRYDAEYPYVSDSATIANMIALLARNEQDRISLAIEVL